MHRIAAQADPHHRPTRPTRISDRTITPRTIGPMPDNILGQLYKNGQRMGVLLRANLQSLQPGSQLLALARQAGFAEHAAESKQRSPPMFF